MHCCTRRVSDPRANFFAWPQTTERGVSHSSTVFMQRESLYRHWAVYLRDTCVKHYQGRRRRTDLERASKRDPDFVPVFQPIVPIQERISLDECRVRPATDDEMGHIMTELADESNILHALSQTPQGAPTTFANSPDTIFVACMQGRLYVIETSANVLDASTRMSGCRHLLPAFAIVFTDESQRVHCQMLWVSSRCRRQGLASFLVHQLNISHVDVALAEAMPFWSSIVPEVTIGKVEAAQDLSMATMEETVISFCNTFL